MYIRRGDNCASRVAVDEWTDGEWGKVRASEWKNDATVARGNRTSHGRRGDVIVGPAARTGARRPRVNVLSGVIK